MDVTGIARQNVPAVNPTEAPVKGDSHFNHTQAAAAQKGGAPEVGIDGKPQSFVSPMVKIDGKTGAAVLSFRDPSSGGQSFQVPSQTALEYSRQQRLQESQAHQTAHPDAVTA